MSTSRHVLLRKLRERGHSVLADAAANGIISAHAAAQYVGIVRGREPTGNGSPNVTKLNAWRIRQLLRGIDEPDEAAKPVALDVEAPKKPELPTLTPGGCGSLPCMTCSSPTAVLARQEIADVWAANQMGDGSRRPNPYGTLPRACCRRNAVVMTAAALIA
jgi:hypothetical protein